MKSTAIPITRSKLATDLEAFILATLKEFPWRIDIHD